MGSVAFFHLLVCYLADADASAAIYLFCSLFMGNRVFYPHHCFSLFFLVFSLFLFFHLFFKKLPYHLKWNLDFEDMRSVAGNRKAEWMNKKERKMPSELGFDSCLNFNMVLLRTKKRILIFVCMQEYQWKMLHLMYSFLLALHSEGQWRQSGEEGISWNESLCLS